MGRHCARHVTALAGGLLPGRESDSPCYERSMSDGVRRNRSIPAPSTVTEP